MGARGAPALAALLVGVVLVPGIADAGHQEATTAKARLHPVGGSGIKGTVSFVDDGSGVQASGSATGLVESSDRYISLVYDVGSVPGGPAVCEPTEELDGMFVGSWSVDALGNGTLDQLNPNVAPIGEFDTVSIRDTEINDGFGPEAVVACGQVAVHHGR